MASDVSNLVYNYAFSSLVDDRAIRLAATTEIAPVVTPGVYFDGRLRHPRENRRDALGVESYRADPLLRRTTADDGPDCHDEQNARAMGRLLRLLWSVRTD